MDKPLPESFAGMFTDEYFMKEALKEAQLAEAKKEIPVGAIVVCEQHIISRAHNLTESLKDVTAHAEMLAITAAANYLGSKYLKNCSLYITLEPCGMCAGAIGWAQLSGLVYGASDPAKGFSRKYSSLLHPKTKIIKGILEMECGQLLTAFFEEKRK